MSHLERFWSQASPQDINDGMGAYRLYRRQMGAFSDHYKIPLKDVTSAFVALSPNSDYVGNLRSLSSVLDGFQNGTPLELITVSTYKACRNRAMSYVTGKADFLATVKGPKIRAFRDNILRPNTSRAVTVDGHMVAAYIGDDTMTMKDAAYHLSRRSQYDAIAAAISDLADNHSVAPCQAQAIIWHTRKRVLDIKFDRQPSLWDPLCPQTYPPYKTAPQELNQ